MIKGLARSAGAYGFGVLISRVASLILLPVYTRILTPADYGVLEVVDLGIQIASTLFGVGLAGDALFYFWSNAEDKREKDRVVCTMLSAAILVSFLGAALATLLGPAVSVWLLGSERYAPIVQTGGAALLFAFPVELLMAYLRARNSAWLFSTVSLARLGLGIVCNLLFLFVFQLGALSMVLSTLVSSCLVTCVLLYVTFRGDVVWQRPSVALVRQVVTYSAPLGVTGGLLMFVHFGDRFFLARNVSTSELGVYGLAYKFGMLVGYVSMSFQLFWRSQMHQILKSQDADAVFVKLFTWLAIAYGAITVGAVLFSQAVFLLLAGPQFLPGEKYLPFIALAYSIRALEYQLQSTLLASARTHLVLRSTASGFAVVVLGYAVLIPIWGAWGAIVSTVLAFTTMGVVTFLAGRTIRKFEFEYSKLVAIGSIVVLVLVLKVWLSPILSYPALLAACLGVAGILALTLPPLAEERQVLVRIGRRFAARA